MLSFAKANRRAEGHGDTRERGAGGRQDRVILADSQGAILEA